MMAIFPDFKIGSIGLGYLGLPLVIEFSIYFRVIGFDIDLFGVKSLRHFHGSTLEVDDRILKERIISTSEQSDTDSNGLFVTGHASHLKTCSIYIKRYLLQLISLTGLS